MLVRMRFAFAAHAFLLCVCLSGLVSAQDGAEDIEMEMFFAPEETVTSAARHEQDIGMSPSAITVLTREDIRTSGAINLVDLFRMVPGLDVIVNSPAFTSVSGRLNWTQENNHCLVLIDGREANFELLGATVFEVLSITIEDIDRIEVIRGPGSALYGANALSGATASWAEASPQPARTSAATCCVGW